MKTGKLPPETHYACREIAAERDRLRAENAELKSSLNELADELEQEHELRISCIQEGEKAIAKVAELTAEIAIWWMVTSEPHWADRSCIQEGEKAIAKVAELTAEITALRTLASDAYTAWDTDRDARVGKLLLAMLNPDFRATYRPDLTQKKD